MTNKQKPYAYSVYIGRFQPFHQGHKAVMDFALEQSEQVIVIVGSANQPRTIKNPFTAHERILMIGSVYEDLLRLRPDAIIFREVNDYVYNDNAWVMNIQNIVDTSIEKTGKDPDDVKIGMVGNKKDYTSYYIDLFPQWDFIEPPVVDIMNATDIRNVYFGDDIHRSKKIIGPLVDHRILMYLENFKTTPDFGKLASEWGFIKDYKKAWEKAPYAPFFMTVDVCLVQSGHILLVERRAEPGKGLLALPGGFVNPKEKLLDAAIRELREETKIKVPEPVLRGSIVSSKIFDAPDRSLRGRTITNTYHISLPPGPLPRVKGGDDALHAHFVPLSNLRSSNMFEDHFDIITDLLGI